MRIALVKKLADAAGLHPKKSEGAYDPLYSWTASWAKVSPTHKGESILFLVNEATKFTVGIYQVKQKGPREPFEPHSPGYPTFAPLSAL